MKKLSKFVFVCFCLILLGFGLGRISKLEEFNPTYYHEETIYKTNQVTIYQTNQPFQSHFVKDRQTFDNVACLVCLKFHEVVISQRDGRETNGITYKTVMDRAWEIYPK